MGARSRDKGARCEREVCRLFARCFGGTWSRVPLSGGWANRSEFATCGDVITTLPDFPFTVECKNAEGWHLEQLLTNPETCLIARWWQQTCAEAAEAGKKPLLVFTRNFQPLFALVEERSMPADARGALHLRLSLGGDVLVLQALDAFCAACLQGLAGIDKLS